MRIVGGKNKGTRLKVAKRGIRPTKAIVREAIFNVIGNLVLEADVLDIFAGSGALGLEALSRGARHCVFIDKNVSILKKNITALRFEKQCRVIKADFTQGLRRLRTAVFDIIFLDPPYGHTFIERTMSTIVRHNMVQPGGIVVAEHGIDEDISIPHGFTMDKKKIYGDTAVLFISFLRSASTEQTGTPVPEVRS